MNQKVELLVDPQQFRHDLDISGIEKPILIDMLRKMIVIRKAEEKIAFHVETGEIKCPCHLGIGQEAVGVAVGLGAQTLVRDILSGIFMLIEDQYGVGDSVDVLDIEGVVEKVGLRVTTVRDGQGTLWYLRNGEILKVGNQSQSG